MSESRQLEVQLGHMCNNRCVFCVSGQETALGRALPAEAAPTIGQLEAGRKNGVKRVTLLGGEPTLQPGFLEVVRAAAALGYEEIVIFTNGVKTARASYVDEVIEAGAGRITWRLSFQGATREAHERTTQKPGSFGRLAQTLDHLAERRQKITVNMCVVRSNYESIDAFPALLLPRGVSQLHLDMMRPLDAGQRTEQELAEAMPRYSDLRGPLERMVAGFPPGFDLNIGNLPYCIAPGLFRYIHHDGEPTDMVAVDGEQRFSRPLDKYLTKRRDKLHPPSCRGCAFAPRCSGVFETYARQQGLGELTPVAAGDLDALDPARTLLAPRLRAALASLRLPAPWSPPRLEERGDRELLVTLASPTARLGVALRDPGYGAASTEQTSLHVTASQGDRGQLRAALTALWQHLAGQAAVRHPLGDDAFVQAAPTVRTRLQRLRGKAPFGQLRFRSVRLDDDGARAEASLEGPAGETATLWLAESQGKPSGGYRVDRGAPTDALIQGLRAAIDAIRG